MSDLERFLKRLSRRAGARWWVGPLPNVRAGQIVEAIAEQLAYPSGDFDPFLNGGMLGLTRSEAAYVIALAGTRSLAYGNKPPSVGVVRQAKQAFDVLSDDAAFFSNGHWGQGKHNSWSPLSSATFDCGVIGYDGETGFIFWVEEED